jgi:hypothetical protein
MPTGYKKTTEEFIRDARKTHGPNKYDYSETFFRTSREKVSIICPREGHGLFNQVSHSHTEGKGCPKCGLEVMGLKHKRTKDEFVREANKVHGRNRFDYTNVVYKNGREKVQIICLRNNHGVFEQAPNDHLQIKGCFECGRQKQSDRKKLPSKEIVRRIQKANPKIVVIGTPNGVTKKVKLSCRVCNHSWQAAPCNLVTGDGRPLSGCPTCAESKGETQIKSFFGVVGIVYERQKRFDTCIDKRHLPFDFYIPKLRVLVEFQGQQHYFPVDFCSKGKAHAAKEFRAIRKHDGIKKHWAKKNGYELIEIKYDENVEEVLTNRLKLKLPKAA